MREFVCKEVIAGGIYTHYEYEKVQELVRCKDCIKLETNKCPMRERLFPNAEFYCADGERKEGR